MVSVRFLSHHHLHLNPLYDSQIEKSAVRILPVVHSLELL